MREDVCEGRYVLRELRQRALENKHLASSSPNSEDAAIAASSAAAASTRDRTGVVGIICIGIGDAAGLDASLHPKLLNVSSFRKVLESFNADDKRLRERS